jgi:small subunit ribosomal protein S6
MTLPAPTYDLVLLLDTQAEESTREKILADARASIQARGELVRDDDWGERPLSYPIGRRKSAEYHLLQFHVSDKELLGGLDRTLRITDGVVRFRLIKLRPGVPDPPDMRSSAIPRVRTEGEAAPGAPVGESAPSAPAAPDAAVAAPAPAPTEAAAPPAAAEPAGADPAAAEAPAQAEAPDAQASTSEGAGQAAQTAEPPAPEAQAAEAEPATDEPPAGE